ncbi:MAG TPA: hypothetical protein VHA52_09295, partial [Candidatus Babeliaceae bacterium]|nr:hypothetical protein [Candidatus Babeliaceae bacterium]
AFICTIIFSLFSTAILSYISMAVMVGPWIELTILLMASLALSFFKTVSIKQKNFSIGVITAGSSIGGIVAIACGFSFPTLYFLEPELWQQWLDHPFYFSLLMATLCFIAGSLGMIIAQRLEHRFLVEDSLPFPIGQMAAKMVVAQNQLNKSIELTFGFVSTLAYSIFISLWPQAKRFITILKPYHWGYISFPGLRLGLAELPLLWSIGFVTGHVIIVPLFVGILTKVLISSPLQLTYFSYLKNEEFMLAFSSGIILYTTLISFTGICLNFIKNSHKLSPVTIRFACLGLTKPHAISTTAIPYALAITICFIVLSYYGFSALAQLYLLIGSTIAAYQLLIIGGKTGLAPMGRFATFVVVPGMLLFNFNAFQIAFVSTFVEICGGVAVDTLFGRKMALSIDLDRKAIAWYQWIGLIVSCISIGFFFWILTSTFQLGSTKLIAQRAQMRALMVGGLSFDFFALIVGALWGALLKEWKINTALVLSGILMPLESSIVLCCGALCTYLFREPEQYYPFWSGMFASGSLWIIVQAILFR